MLHSLLGGYKEHKAGDSQQDRFAMHSSSFLMLPSVSTTGLSMQIALADRNLEAAEMRQSLGQAWSAADPNIIQLKQLLLDPAVRLLKEWFGGGICKGILAC
jgi:hypothetical protein